MKNATLIAAAGLIVLCNAIALVHAARNRAGEPEAEIALTDRELSYYDDPDDSGVSLRLNWLDPDAMWYSTVLEPEDRATPWLDAQKLADLGFDVSMPPADKRAERFYSRQIARTGYVALEYDGPAWQAWADARRKLESERAKHGSTGNVEDELRSSTRLVLIDAGSDPAALRTRHPDRHKVVITPAVFRIQVRLGPAAIEGRAERPALLAGDVRQIPSEVHVPRPFSEGFRDRDHTTGDPGHDEPQYWVHLSYGSLLEPWVTGVELDPKRTPR